MKFKMFSITNTANCSHRVINILGLKIKFKYNTSKNYKRALKRIKDKSKFKVVFLVAENSKWVYQSLYDLLAKSELFEPLVLVFPLLCVHKKADTTRNNLEENYNFFKSRNMNVAYSYKNNEYINLKNFNPDLVFYEQQWELPDIYKPQYASQFALTCYTPYGYPLFNLKYDYTKEFHANLYKLFTDSELTLNRLKRYNKKAISNSIIVGYSKFDAYLNTDKTLSKCNKLKIIYAPHHSFTKNSLNCATFCKNGKFILDLAKSHPETTWIFKPHPRFKFALLKNNIMTEQEIEAYYNEWEKIGSIYEQGDYFDIFKSSDLMITDCCSFLGEYLPTGNPLIRPINNDSIKLNELGEKVVTGYYQVSNNIELERIFKQLVIDKNDPKKQIRKENEKYIIDRTESSAQKIYNYLVKVLE